MNAIEYIKENTEPRTILDYFGFKSIKETDYQIRACCAIHGGDNPEAFIWNKANDLWFCYTGECGGGDVFDLVMKIQNVDFKTAVAKVASILGLDITGMKIDVAENRLKNEQRMWLKRQLNNLNKDEPVEIDYEILEVSEQSMNRFSENTERMFGGISCNKIRVNDTEFYNKFFIPVYKNKELFCTALRDMGEGDPRHKWIYQPRGVKLSNELYNLDHVLQGIDEGLYEEIIIVEGIFDVWRFFESGIGNVVAIFGSNISKEQYKTLMKLNVNLAFCFDHDSAGIKCTKKAIEMFDNKVDYTTIILPVGKDPADCTTEELMTAYLNRR